MISVVGGCYAEQCLVPSWNYVYGSAGRAAAALSFCTGVELHTLLSTQFQRDFLLLMSIYEVHYDFIPEECSVSFEYLHPLASPYLFIEGARPDATALPHVRNDNILVFGMVEYTPVVHGKRVVYDPQSAKPKLFSQTGSTADELVYVLNGLELEKITNMSGNTEQAAAHLLSSEGAAAVVVKLGPGGALVISSAGTAKIPCYRARRVFKIGSGDIFAAAFAYFWQIENKTFKDAADLASRAVACYVETSDAFIPTERELLKDYNQAIYGPSGKIYLAAPFFSLEQRWVLEETKVLLESFGCDVFSPLHHVGTGRSDDELAAEDLAGLNSCDAVMAIMNDNDPGTVFELGYGRAGKKPVIVYAEKNSLRDLVMLNGTGCLTFPDYCSAIYSAVWGSQK